MKKKIYFLLAAAFSFFAFSLIINFGSSPVSTLYTINLTISPDEAWWAERINATGTVILLSTGAPVANAQVNVTLLGTNCTANTNSGGVYSCNLTAPSSLGEYEIAAEVNDTAAAEAIAATTFTVALNYGPQPGPATDRAVYEAPILIQEPSGKITKAMVRVLVWRG